MKTITTRAKTAAGIARAYVRQHGVPECAAALAEYDAQRAKPPRYTAEPYAASLADGAVETGWCVKYDGEDITCDVRTENEARTVAALLNGIPRAKENPMSGFEYLPENRAPRFVSEDEAKHLLRNYARDVSRALASLRAHPYARLTCEGGEIRHAPPRLREWAAGMVRSMCADPATVRRALDFAASRMHLNETERATLRGIADFLLEMERAP